MAGPKSLVAKPKCRSSDLFVRGHARVPYMYKQTWEDMMSTDRESDSVSEIAVSAPQPAAKKIKSCACSVALGAHEQAFKAMKVTGTVLKKRQRYKAKGDADCLHRDIQAQNAWLLANIFDASGNYLYCAACIVSVLGVREKRLARLRKVKLPAEHKLDMILSYRVLQGMFRFMLVYPILRW